MSVKNNVEAMEKSLKLDGEWLKFYTNVTIENMKKAVALYQEHGMTEELMTSFRMLQDDINCVGSIDHILSAHGRD